MGEAAPAAVATVIIAAAATTTTAAVAVTAAAMGARTAVHTAAATTCLPHPWGARVSRAPGTRTIDTTGHAAHWPRHRHHQPRRRHREGPQCGMSGALKAQVAGSIRPPMTGLAQAAAVVHLLCRPGPKLAAAAAPALPARAVDRSSGFLPRPHRASQRALLHGTAAVETITIIAGAAPLAVAQAVGAPAAPIHTRLLLWAAEATQTASPMVGWEVALAQGTGTRRGVACAGIEPFERHASDSRCRRGEGSIFLAGCCITAVRLQSKEKFARCKPISLC